MSNTRTATEQSEHGSQENPAVEAGMSRDILNIPDNLIVEATAQYPQAAQDAIQWAFTYGRHELGNSRNRLCELLDVDWTTLWRVAMNKYPAGIGGVIEKIQDLQRRVQENSRSGFVETMVTKRIFATLDYALAGDVSGGRIVLISGHTRRGKTEAVKQWARDQHGRSIYIDCPVVGGMRALLQEMADATGINSSRRTSDILERLHGAFNRRRILIVDEILRLLPHRRADRRPTELEFLRRLHDRTRCAVALIATPTFQREMECGWLRDYLEQLLGRIVEPLTIPERVHISEARDICRAYNKSPDDALVKLAHTIANERGKFGVLFELLGQAAAIGKRKGEPVTHALLSSAYKRRKERYQWPEDTTA